MAQLTQVELIDHPKEEFKFELVDRASGHSLILTAHRDGVKEFWLREIKEFVKHFGESEDTGIEEFQIDSTPTELSASSRKTEALPEKLAEPLKVPEVNVEQPQPTTPKPAEPVKLQEVKVTHTKSVPVEPTKSKANPEPPKSKPNSEPQKKSTSELQNSNPKLEQPNSEPNLEPPKFAKQVAEPNVKSLEPKASTQGTLKLPTWEAPKQPSLQSPNIKVDKLPEINPATFPSITANTTKSVSAKSESGILKDIPTAKAKPAEGEHILPKIQAVEPLVHLNQPRVLEEYIPYLQKPAPEQVPGSAINKVYSVESVSISDAVLKDYSVGIGLEVNVEIDDMSRRYTSSTHAEGVHSGSSYTRRSGHTTSDGLPSSRYATESITSKYGAESSLTGGSKYDDLTSKYSKSYSVDSSDAALSSSYTRRSTALEGDNDYIYSRKSIKSSSTSGEGNGDSFSYSRRMKSRIGDDDGDYSYSKRSSRSLTQSSGEVGDNENSVYTRRSIRATAEAVGDGNSYSVRKSLRTSIEGTGIEGTKTETHSSYSRRAIGLSDKDSSYYKRSTSAAGAESDISNIYSTKSNTTREEDEEDVLSKYSRKYSRTDSTDRTAIGEEGDVYAKYTRKYSRTDFIKDDEDTKYPRRLSRTDSKEKSKQAEELEEDAYAKYANKYYRNKPSETKSTKSEEEKSKYSRSYDRTDSHEKKYIKSQISKNQSEDTGNESTTVAAVTTVNGKETKTEAFDEHYATHVVQESLSTSAKMVCEKSATDKLEEVKADDRPKFIKTIRGTNIEPGESVHFDVALNERPDTFMWLKDNQSLNADGSMSGRIQWTCCEKGHEYKLLIKQVRNEDAGLYTAIASNEKGKASCSAQLVVHELTTDERHDREHYDKPEFLVSFKDTELLEDTYLRFIVKIRGEPNPEIAFFKDGVKIMENQERLKIVKEHSDTGFYELVIPEVKHSDAGVYKCIATNKWGEASCEATVTVTDSKKVFEDMPEGEILPPGEKSVFQWKKDGAPFEPDERFKVLLGDDEDSLALVFQHVRPDDVGLYTCVAQTSRGHISCSAELTVHGTVNQLFREPEKPTLIIEKKEPIVNVGGSAMLELQVKGYPKPTVKFSHNGKEIEPSNKFKFLYEDEESMSLVIKNVTSEDAGKYTVTAENEIGIESAEMTLTVKAPPSIKTKMQDLSVHAEETIRIPIEIEGIPKPTVQFYKDGKEFKKNERIKVVDEAEKHVLVIEKSTLKDTGSYSVVATNELAQVSQFWNIEIFSKPTIKEKLGKDKVVSQGENVELKLKVEAEPAPEIQWFKDEQEIKSNEHFVIRNDGDSYILKITGTVTTDASRYKFRAVNIHGSVEDEVKVDVKKAPKIVKPLQDMTVKEKDTNVTFDVKLEAFPKPTVKWYLDEVEIMETRSEFTRIESDDGAKLIIKEVNSELSGQYTCKLSNECGAAETSAKLTVNCVPRILKHLKDTTVEEGATLHLEIEVEGCPTPTVKWLRNGREVSADARIKITRDTQRHETFNLTVNLIKYEEQGEYEVVVTNTMGTVSSKSFVTVHKVTHTDAIEETEPPSKINAEAAEEEPQVAKNKEVEEVKQKPTKLEPKTLDELKTGQGSTSEKIDIVVKQFSAKSPEPIIEEPSSPKIPQRSISATIEEVEVVETNETHPSSDVREESIPKRKPSRGKSMQFEEIELVENVAQQITITNVELPPGKLQSSISAHKEEEAHSKKNLERGLAASKENAEIVEGSLDKPATPSETEVPKPLSKKGKSVTIGEVEEHKSDNGAANKPREEMVQIQKIHKIKRDYVDGNDEGIERLLEKAQRQRSFVGDLSVKSDQAIEAVPVILDSNMKDGSRPESLDIIYVVKGSANPLPTATWTRDGSEIKPDTNLRMSVSQNGEEFKLEIKKLDMKDAGVYRCTLSNPLGAAKQQATLEVTPERDLRRPKLKECLKDQTIVKKTSVTFKAVVIGDPIPEVTWLKDGKEITSDEYEQFKIMLESEDHEVEDSLKECSYSLTIPRCERCNAGKFLMRAKNKWGECDSGAELTIILRPEIEGPEDVSVVPGQATEFTVVIQSYPVPEVTWTKDDVKVEAGELIDIIEDVPNETYKLIFHKVLLADEGYYKVTAKNHLGETSSEARLRTIKETEPTTERPKFISGLTDEQVEDRGEITVMVRADGLPKPHILWYCNGKELAEDEHHKIERHTETHVTSSLTVSNYNEADVGFYKAVAVNVVGEAESTARITMLQTPPSFGKRLERSEDVNEGEPLELKAKVGGSPKPQVSWFKDGEPIPENDPNIKISLLPDGTVKLNIEKAKPEDSGAYKLVIRNSNGETACLCAVAVTPKAKRPKFLKCFKDMKVPLGQPLRLEAKVEAYPPPEIKWVKDGLPVRASSNIRFENHPDGRVALIVDCLRPENAGSYRLILTNKLGETTGEAEVEIEKKPRKPDFIQRLVPQTVVEGFPVKFEVKAEGFPVPTIKWLRNDAEVISDSKHIKIMDQPDGTSILLLDAVDEVRDALTYKAVASNEAGHAETYADLTVKPAAKKGEPEERPVYIHSLKDVITDEGQALIMEAPFTGNPIPSVDWTKDGKPIQASDRVLLTCDGRKVGIKIDHAVPSDAGVYGVTISNPLGKESTEGKVTVHKVFMPPSFTQKFTDLQQLPDRDAKFPYRVTGVPQPEVSWSKDGVPLKDSGKYRIRRDGDAGCLYVLNCEPNDAGVYRATATSKEGQDICTATLEVVKEIKTPKKIEPPVFLKRIGDTELFKAMTAKFTACASGSPDPTIDWYHNDQKLFPSNRIRMEKDTNGLLRLTILGVDQDDLGKYTCKITNEHGSDICHAQLKFDEGIEPKPKRPITDQYTEFDKYKRSGAPMPLSDPPIISQMTDRHCTLSWKPSIPSAPRIPVTYQLEMCELPHGDWFTVRTGIRSCTCGVRNLEPFRDYKFRVRVENKYGISDPSPYAITHREKLEPEIPKFRPYLPPEIDFRPETSPYFPKDFDIERPPHDNMAQAPRFLRQEHDIQYGVKDQNTNLFWFVYGYPKPKVSFYFNDELIESGGRFDMSYTRNGQATLFINKMLERDVGWYEAVARNEHGEARQRVRLEIAEPPYFIRRPEIEYVMLRGKARFEARIIGVPFPNLKWYKDWKPVAPSSRIKIIFTEPDTTVLMINDIILKDEGLYSVSARNVAGSASSSAMLHIEENDLEYSLRNYTNLSPIKAKKRVFTDAYDIGDELGRGTQGVTYHAAERINGRNYAAKIMHGRDELRPFMYNELEVHNELRHKKLISLHDAYDHDDSLTLVLELASGGELVKDYLLKQEYYTESDIAGFIRQLLQGLQYMHERGYGHMGLNLGDLLISHPGGDDLKITDFGLSRRIAMGRLAPLRYGVPEYVSPEAANGEGTGLGHDIWSVGIITYILLSGRSPFRGLNDMETLTNVRSGKWVFDDEWWSHISTEARDFISKLLVYQAEGRLDVHSALRHPWLERADKRYTDEYRISTKYLSDYWKLYREWYDNASCKKWYRRRPLEGAFTHPSKMVYPPGEYYSPRTTPLPERTPKTRTTWEDQLPSRSPLNYEIGVIKSESHYQNGPDTYLLQLRDVDFPVRLREYMKVATNRGPGAGYIMSDENGYDWRTPIIHERRRFTDIMDEEIDDERRTRINRYGTGDTGVGITRRLKHELGSRLDTYVEAEAFLESKQEGRLPFFREKPYIIAMQEGHDLKLSCFAVGEPQPIVQWFKSDAIIAESHRIKIITDAEGRSQMRLSPALAFDQGMYKIVARNKVGQTVARTRIVMGLVPDEPDSPEAGQISDTEILLTWKQPKFDGNSPVLCYCLEYKLADDMEWKKKADNIDHEFYLMTGLEVNRSYLFRLAAKNSIGWSEKSVPSAPVMTKTEGSSKVQLGKAMRHLQQITDSGAPVEEETSIKLNYAVETQPIEWENLNSQDLYNFISEISRGRFSAVVKAVEKSTDTIYVAKLLELSPSRKQDVEGEFAALRSLRHERIAGLVEAYRTNSSPVATFILEKLQGADILTYLASRHEYTEQTVATIVSQVLDGLQYLHWRGLCHLDLQPDNIVMSGVRSVSVKLVDFGCAHRVTKLGTKVPVVGHRDYISPEVLAEELAIPQTDIWTVGVLTYVMLSGSVPFKGEDENETRQNILFVRYRFEHLYQEISQEATRFIMLLFKRQPNKRPTADDCHENRWLLPTDHMIKKRERAIFLGNRIKEYSKEYHVEKAQAALHSSSAIGGKFIRSQSIHEELLTVP